MSQHPDVEAAWAPGGEVVQFLFKELRKAYADLGDDVFRAMVLMALDEGIECRLTLERAEMNDQVSGSWLFSTFIVKFNNFGSYHTHLNKSFNAAVGSAQSRLLPQGRRFAELAGQNVEIDVSDQIDEVVREIQPGE